MPAATTTRFDHACRLLLRRAGVPLLCWLLRIAPANLRFVRWLDTRLTQPDQPERVGDTIAHVLRADQELRPWAIPVEFQAEPDPLMFGRAMMYEAMIWLEEKPSAEVGDRFDLQSVIVNLTGVGHSGRRMAWQPGAGTSLEPIEWNLETLDANVILEQAARGEAPLALLALVSLMKNGGDPVMMRRWREVAELETDPRRKADLALVRVFAQLKGRLAEWTKALEGFNVLESIVLKEYVAQGEVKGKVEGLLTGLEALLEARFSDAGLALMPDLRKVEDPTRLASVLQTARKAASLDDFRRDAGVWRERQPSDDTGPDGSLR